MPSSEYMKQYRESRKLEAISILGGRCSGCGSEEDLEFDHVDPGSKSFNISGFSRSWTDILIELKKCQLLCSLCHEQKSSIEQTYRRSGHGSVAEAKRGCGCEPCVLTLREARARWNKKYRLKSRT